ncbi:hypothetical protein BGZ49_007724 [Haplosporangium sp. Z 27]|nr:hypothetical protein BGZ49_007724 [Haplosporangium sp. Z 27]
MKESRFLYNESLFDHGSILDSLPDISNQWQDEQQQTRESQENATISSSFNAIEWEAEHLELLLGITEQDVKAPSLDQSNININNNFKNQHLHNKNLYLNAREQTLQPFPVAEIKQPNTKEDFIHPGFYSLSNQNKSESSTSSQVPQRINRKRSLQEIGSPCPSFEMSGATVNGLNRSPLPYAAELRRHSLDGYHSTLTAASTSPHSWVYSTPPKSPPTPCLNLQGKANSCVTDPQQYTDIPPGQPYMTTLASGWALGQEQSSSPSLQQTRLVRFQRSSAPKSSQSPLPQPRKRRASKFKTDLLFPTFPGGLQYPLNAVPPPLQQQHHQPYLTPQYAMAAQQALHKQNPLQRHHRQGHSRLDSRSTTHRRNPGEVPASTLPPDHFVFQEALLGIGYGYQLGGIRPQSILHTDTNSTGSVNTKGSSRKQMSQALTRRSSAPVNLSCYSNNASKHHQEKTPASPPHSLSSSPVAQLTDSYTRNSSISLALDAIQLDVEKSSTKLDPLTDNISQSSTNNAVDQAAAAFAQSLSTVSTLDPAATKLIDQLRLQEYLRTVEPTSTPSPPSTMATSIIAHNSSIAQHSPSSSPALV